MPYPPPFRRILFICVFLTLLLSIPSLMRLPRVLPFLDANVRAAAPKALEELRKEGLWLVNVELVRIEKTDDSVCFHWEHQYRSRERIGNIETLQTCI